MSKIIQLGVISLILAMFGTAANATTIYSNNFDGSETFAASVSGGLSGATTLVAVPAGYAATGIFSGMMLHNATGGGGAPVRTILTLNDLPSHDAIDVDFALAIIDSWDSVNGTPSPDYFNVVVDGVSIFQQTYALASGSVDYPDPDGTLIATTGNLGFSATAPYFDKDRAYNAAADSALMVAHTADSLTLELFASGTGWQGGVDESWGIDNLTVTAVTMVPLPAALWLFGTAICGVLFRRRC